MSCTKFCSEDEPLSVSVTKQHCADVLVTMPEPIPQLADIENNYM